jgi:hypothetical protein
LRGRKSGLVHSIWREDEAAAAAAGPLRFASSAVRR